MIGILINIFVWLVAILAAGFVLWRRLKNEIEEDELWTLMISIFIASLFLGRTGWWVLQLYEPGWSYLWWWQVIEHPGFEIWSGLLGAVIMIWWKFKKAN